MVVVDKPPSWPVHPCGGMRYNTFYFITLYCIPVVDKPPSWPVHPCGGMRYNTFYSIKLYCIPVVDTRHHGLYILVEV